MLDFSRHWSNASVHVELALAAHPRHTNHVRLVRQAGPGRSAIALRARVPPSAPLDLPPSRLRRAGGSWRATIISDCIVRTMPWPPATAAQRWPQPLPRLWDRPLPENAEGTFNPLGAGFEKYFATTQEFLSSRARSRQDPTHASRPLRNRHPARGGRNGLPRHGHQAEAPGGAEGAAGGVKLANFRESIAATAASACIGHAASVDRLRLFVVLR